MRQFTPREKDDALKYYYGNPSSAKPSEEIRDILKSAGYVEYVSSPNGSLYRITDKGKGFILQGGYTEQDKALKSQKRFTLQMNAMGWLVTIIASIIGVIGGFILSKLTQ